MAGSAGDAFLFEEAFTVTSVDQSKYDRVARISATSTDNLTVMTLDLNIELFNAQVNEGLDVVLASTLSRDSGEEQVGWKDLDKAAQGNEPSLADDYEYVCHGKIYKFEDSGDDGQTIKAYVSFGGLLMSLEGPYKKLTPLRVEYAYLLIRK